MKYSLFDTVILTKDIPEYSLKSGMVGAIIDVYTNPNESYEIEFCDEEGKTIQILVLSLDQISKI